MIISFSGMDGAGKSTQIELLKAGLAASNVRTYSFWFRGGYTPGFQFAKDVARKLLGKSVPPPGKGAARDKIIRKGYMSRIWLYCAIFDMIFWLGIVLRMQDALGKCVICDRYLDDTRLDFSLNFEGADFESMWTWRLLTFVAAKPDVSFLLIIPVEESLRRSVLKNEPFPDDEETLRNRLERYTDETLFNNRYTLIDGKESIESVQGNISARIASAGKLS